MSVTFINVQDPPYNAVGDYVDSTNTGTDNTAAFNSTIAAAINAEASGIGCVFVPPGFTSTVLGEAGNVPWIQTMPANGGFTFVYMGGARRTFASQNSLVRRWQSRATERQLWCLAILSPPRRPLLVGSRKPPRRAPSSSGAKCRLSQQAPMHSRMCCGQRKRSESVRPAPASSY